MLAGSECLMPNSSVGKTEPAHVAVCRDLRLLRQGQPVAGSLFHLLTLGLGLGIHDDELAHVLNRPFLGGRAQFRPDIRV
jgi:hypothetical protein